MGDRDATSLYIPPTVNDHQVLAYPTEMKSIQVHADGLLALMLIASVAACGPDAQTVQEEAPVASQPAAPAQSSAMQDRFANMFVDEVTDAFNPGVQIGTQFPAIRAMHQGEEITTVDRFIRDKGMIFIAMRSADW